MFEFKSTCCSPYFMQISLLVLRIRWFFEIVLFFLVAERGSDSDSGKHAKVPVASAFGSCPLSLSARLQQHLLRMLSGVVLRIF